MALSSHLLLHRVFGTEYSVDLEPMPRKCLSQGNMSKNLLYCTCDQHRLPPNQKFYHHREVGSAQRGVEKRNLLLTYYLRYSHRTGPRRVERVEE